MENESDAWLVLIFGQTLKIGFAPKGMEDKFRVGATEYRCDDPDYLTAFVDRLLDQEERLVGFFISPVSQRGQMLVASLAPRPYLRFVWDGLEVWISEAAIDDACNAGDQAFGGRVFGADNGELAMTIATRDLLSRSDLEVVALANAELVEVR